MGVGRVLLPQIEIWVYMLENPAGKFYIGQTANHGTCESLADIVRTIAQDYRLNLPAGDSFLSD